ncbi:pyridoxal phosphatase [Vibrio quintilis]|uniref:Pyridoxal phosphate phosphatase YbhA n=1 Tax=Vibrio quintilis TaxID=1117707 RepID=A0A1M7YV94_9VIBR|nr:pyridoxal phosphatase [Vibrio quintilis]SHO56473.1 Pyridoxal phosphate phosphatase YbhA [Vibrio quintilis]
MYKVLALDLDGTVLTDDHTILPQTIHAIREAQKHCHVVIVTGRHHTAAKPYYQAMGLTTPAICCNGTYVYDYQSGTVLKQNAIDKPQALKFIDLAGQFQMKVVMYITHAMTYSRQNPIAYMEALEKWAAQYPAESRPRIQRIDSFSETAKEADYIWKFVVEGMPSSIERFIEHPWVQQHFNGERSWSNRIDFAAQGNNKGKRLAEYVSELGYSSEHVLAAGDNHNDISMIQYAGLGVAMQNADATVRTHARLVCPTDNNGTGLAELILQKIKG